MKSTKTVEGKWINKQNEENLIIWVHGILSSSESCWQSAEMFWPQAIANDYKLLGYDNYIYSYHTSIFSSNYSLSDIVDNLKEHIKLENLLSYEKIIFVCHSMGGIVVRKFIVERVIELLESKSTFGLFLIASPSLGSKYADFFSLIAKFMNHSQAKALQFIEKNQWISDLNKEFRNLKESNNLKLFGKELIEDRFILLKRLFRRQQIVSPISGAQYFGEPIKIPNSNHFSIAKPENKTSLQYRLLVHFLIEIQNKKIDTTDYSRIIDNNIIEISSQEELAFGITIGWNIAAIEFLTIDGNDFNPESRIEALEEIKELVKQDGYEINNINVPINEIRIEILNFYRFKNIQKESYILLGMAGRRLSTIFSSFEIYNNKELYDYAISPLNAVNSTVIKNKDYFINELSKGKIENIFEFEEMINNSQNKSK